LKDFIKIFNQSKYFEMQYFRYRRKTPAEIKVTFLYAITLTNKNTSFIHINPPTTIYISSLYITTYTSLFW